MLGDKLKGFPLYMEMFVTQQGMNMTITNEVTELKKDKVDTSKFSMTPPEGYTKMEGM
jgi:outer membrane lipoprotein-sorting protein